MQLTRKLSEVSGGVPFIAYPIGGCVTYMGIAYMNNPDVSGHDLGRSCGKGAIHSMNPALGLSGSVATSAFGKYMFSVAYSGASSYSVDWAVPQRKNPGTCDASSFIDTFPLDYQE